jgi:uncharacterized membrane protein
MGEIIFGWVFLSFVCGFVLEGKNTGFWGTFFLCLFLSPLLGVIISATSGNKEIRQTKNQIKTNKKQELLKQIEHLKKEEELGLISEEGKIKLDELTAVYKNYDEWSSIHQKNKSIELEKQKKQGRTSLYKTLITIVFVMMVMILIFYFLTDLSSLKVE